MADLLNLIGLEAIFNDENFQQGIAGYNSATDDASSRTESAGSTMSATWEGLSAVGQVAFGAIAAGIAAMTVELYAAVDAAMEAEDEMARVDFVVSGTAERTGVTTAEVEKLAASLTKVLPIDDEVMAQAIAMGLTFDGVNKDNIEPLISAAADLAAWTGRDLPATMKSLSMAITDPDKAMRLLKEANITLTDAQMKTLKGFKDTGDAAGATTFILEQMKKKGIIGLGEAMGQTAKGKMTIMQTALANIQETLGGGLMNALGGAFDRITEFANNPETTAFFAELGAKIGELASKVLSSLPSIMDTVKGIGDWFVQNKPLVIGVLAAIGVALLAFGYTAAAAGIAAMAGLWPVIAVMAVVGAAVALLYTAWTENWGGIQEKVASAWAEIKPTFDKLQAWIKENLPKAIKKLSEYWTNVLLPAIKKAFDWIADNVLPLLVDLVKWLEVNVPKAIKTLSDFWTNVLLPAIIEVANWITNSLIPTFKVVWDWLATNLPKAIKTLSDFWNNVLLPAIKAVSDFFMNVLLPNFMSVVSFISGVFTTAITGLSAIWTNVLLPAITAIYNFFNNYIMPVIRAVANLIDAVLSVALRALAGLWQNVLLPAIQGVWSFLSNNILAVFNSITSTIQGPLTTALNGLKNLWADLKAGVQLLWDKLEPFRAFLAGALKNAFQGVWDIVQKIISKINEWAQAIRNLQLPGWLTPGSPTPFEMGLRGINEQLALLASSSLPTVKVRMEEVGSMQAMRDVASMANRSAAANTYSSSNTRTSNYLYGAQFNVPNQSGMIEILQGLA